MSSTSKENSHTLLMHCFKQSITMDEAPFFEIFKCLLKNGADANQMTKIEAGAHSPNALETMSILHYIMGIKQNAYTAKWLHEALQTPGVEVDIIAYQGHCCATPLMMATGSGLELFMAYLLAYGADPDFRPGGAHSPSARDFADKNDIRRSMFKAALDAVPKLRKTLGLDVTKHTTLSKVKVDKRMKACNVCGKTKKGDRIQLMKCAICLQVQYCSKECQKEDWAEHKLTHTDQKTKTKKKKKKKKKKTS